MYSLQMLRYFRGSYFRGAKLARMSDGSYCIIRDLGLVKGGKGLRHFERLLTLTPKGIVVESVQHLWRFALRVYRDAKAEIARRKVEKK